MEEHQTSTINVDDPSRVVDQRKVPHSGAGIAAFIVWLLEMVQHDVSAVAIGIETPRGPIVEGLIERGFHVYAINPKQLDRFRDRHSVAGNKNDRLDAFVLADSLRTDRPRFRRVRLNDPSVLSIREIARVDEDLCEEFGRLSNRLRDQLHRYFAQMLELCPAANQPWLWTLLELIPDPMKVKSVSKARVQTLLRKHKIRRITAQEVLDKLKTLPLPVAPGVTEAARAHIELLIPRLKLVHQQRKECKRRIEALFGAMPSEDASGQKVEHRDVDIILSLPGVGRCVAATVFAEASQPLEDRDYHGMRTLGGLAPVTKQTGKQGKPGSGRRVFVMMRRACSRRLRIALYHMSRVAVQKDTACHEAYAEMRRRGHTHGRTLRSIGDRLLRILFAMLRSRQLYDPDFATARTPEAAAA